MAYPPAPQYPQQPSPEGPRTRPAMVTAVVWTQFLTAAVLVASAIASLSVADATADAMMRALESDPAITDSGADISSFGDWARIGAYIGVGVYILFAVFYVILGLLNNRGNRPGRVLSWVLAGISLACCGLGQLIGLGMQGLTAGSGQDYNDEMMQAIEDATPMWAAVLNWVALFMFIVGSLLIIILLATPASNEFFRKDEAPMGPYMGQPPYGQQPGQPPYGGPQQPGQPPYGGPQQPGQQPPGSEPPAPPQP